MNNDCLFCSFVSKEKECDIVYEDDLCIAFKDINPRSRVHILIVPRKHISTISDITDEDEKLMGHLINVAKKLAAENNSSGYQLLFNVGKEGGQIIFHIHLHLMGK